MSTFLALRVLFLAGEMLAVSTLVMALAWLAAFRKTASLRHLVWAAAFGALILLPALDALVPGSFAVSVPEPAAAVAMDPSAAATVPPAPESLPFDITDAALVLIAIWLAGACLIALGSVIAAFVLRTMRRKSVENPFDESELPQLARARRYELRVSDAECGPVAWGLFRPVILLPNKALFWPGERLHAALLHEFAHIRRRDSLTQMLSLVACTLYWPNPLVWIGARLMRREAEMAADDAAIDCGMAPSAYAGELLHIAQEFRARTLSPSMALFMAAPSALAARVQSVLAPTQQRSGVTSMDVLKISGIALLATTALVLAHPSLAQDAPQAPAAPSSMAAPPSPPADVAAPVAPTPPDDAVSTDKPVHHFHTREVRRFTDSNGRHHVEIVERDGDAAQALADVQPEIDRAMAQVKASEVKIRAIQEAQPQIDAAMRDVGPQIEKALAEARAQLAGISDEKLRERVDQALARAQAKIEAAQTRGNESRREEVTKDTDTPDSK
jgi:beta-lactamase regulating signal transducer with metallopeptidase domain/ElaB/YqjD/DUF883 family membrane-anchored ribosome-binding protein